MDLSDTPAESALVGHDRIHAYLKTLDSSPGVYRMLDAESRVLYVGKARNLRARVSNYARASGHSRRIARMISETTSMMFLTTRTETEALLLEQNLIKQLKPRYNVLLRDDKSFPNIVVTGDHAFPMIRKHRGAKTGKGAYYGPFASAGAVTRTLNQLQKAFLLRNCTDSMFEGRTRPCLQYQIKRCSGPCVGKISAEDYAQTVQDAERFLSGRSTQVQEHLAAAMAEAAEAMEFERAAALRDRIRAMTSVQTAQGINPRGVSEADIIALHMDGGQACVQVFFIRNGVNLGNKPFFPSVPDGALEGEVLYAFLAQFYLAHEVPTELLLSCTPDDGSLLGEVLETRAQHSVTLSTRLRGQRLRWME
ncbi:MAG: excinuclease ABC subunit UvrC, partial [Paracoccaceae bacterium]